MTIDPTGTYSPTMTADCCGVPGVAEVMAAEDGVREAGVRECEEGAVLRLSEKE